MGDLRLLNTAKDVKSLANRLETVPQVRALDTDVDREAWTLAHAFEDLEQSFLVVLQDQLPRLTRDPLDATELHDLLLDVGEELRHILYHITHTRFYDYLCEHTELEADQKEGS